MSNEKQSNRAPYGSVKANKEKYDKLASEKGNRAAALEMIKDIHRTGGCVIR